MADDPRGAQGSARTEAPHVAHRDRDRAGSRDGRRHVHADRLDRPGLRLDLHRRPQGVERSDQRQDGIRPLERRRLSGADARRLAARQGARPVRRRGGRRQRRRTGTADREERQGDRLRRRAEPRLQHRERRLALQPAHPRRRIVAAAGRRRDRRVDREEGALQAGTDRRGPGGRPGAQVADLGVRPLRLGLDDRRRDTLGLRPADGPAVVRQARPAGRDRGRCEAGRVRRRARSRASGEHSCDRAGENGRPAGRGRCSGDERLHLVPARLPARLRRDRALRRQLRDRQLALDHDRPANARVRDPTNRGRLAPADPDLDPDRGPRRRCARVARRAPGGLRAGEGPVRAVRRRRLHAAEQRPRAHPDRRADRARGRDRRHGRREPSTRLPCDARASARGRARRSDLAAVAARVPARSGVDPPDRARLRRPQLGALRAWSEHDHAPRSGWAWAR